MDAGVQGAAAAVCVLSIRRRSASVHWRVVRVDGAGATRSDHRAAMEVRAGPRSPCRTTGRCHAETEIRNEDDREKAVRGWWLAVGWGYGGLDSCRPRLRIPKDGRAIE